MRGPDEPDQQPALICPIRQRIAFRQADLTSDQDATSHRACLQHIAQAPL